MTAHTAWCARGHHCGPVEHRGAPIAVDIPANGRATLVRLRTDDGQEYAEIRIRITLHPHEHNARRQLRRLLTDLGTLITRAGRPRPTA